MTVECFSWAPHKVSILLELYAKNDAHRVHSQHYLLTDQLTDLLGACTNVTGIQRRFFAPKEAINPFPPSLLTLVLYCFKPLNSAQFSCTTLILGAQIHPLIRPCLDSEL